MKEYGIQKEYIQWIKELKLKIKAAQSQAVLSINSQLILLYWELGKEISEKQKNSSWGSNFIERTASELTGEFPEMKGFSRRNLYAIVQWYKFYSSIYEFVPQPVAQIPWGHNRLIINKIHDIEEAMFYASETVRTGWDRGMLEIQIENDLFHKAGKSVHNFNNTLPDERSRIVSQTFKDPYNFDFLGLHEEFVERDIEYRLTHHITEFLIELGKGFAFVGRQYKIEVGNSEYFIDMLFYHLELRCYIAIELKVGKFKPEYAGKLNFYLSAIDSQLKKVEDNPSIGILICRKKDKIEAEYALRDINKPIGISEFRLTDMIPENIQANLPSIEEIENEVNEKAERYFS